MKVKDRKQQNERKAFNCGPIDYKDTKTSKFEKKTKMWKIAKTGFLGKYQDARQNLNDNKLIELGND